MYACHRTHHQRQKRTGAGSIFARRMDHHYYDQDRDERHIKSYWYNSNSVRMFDSIGIIELDTSQNIALAGVGKATRKKYGGCSREVNTMKVLCRRTRSRGLVLTTTTMTNIITTCTADRDESLLKDMKEYVPDLILTTEVVNLLLRCYSNCSGPTRPGEGGRRRRINLLDIPRGPSP